MVSYIKVNLETNFVFDFISHDCLMRLLKYFFCASFSKKETMFSFLLPASRTCPMPRRCKTFAHYPERATSIQCL